jgi:hypothetical protein
MNSGTKTTLGSAIIQTLQKIAILLNTAYTRPLEKHQDYRGGTAASRRARFQAVCVA